MSEIETETTFDVPHEPVAAWKALEQLRLDHDVEPGTWWLPGFDCPGTEVEAVPAERLTVRKAAPPCEGTVIAVTFEHVDTGTRIRVVQSGFDQTFVDGAGEAFWTHAEHIFADVELFFRTGVLGRRAWRPQAWLGLGLRTTTYGAEVTGTLPDSWAERVGLQSGDLVLTLANAPIYGSRDVGTVQHVVQAGDHVRATWVRDGERQQADAPA